MIMTKSYPAFASDDEELFSDFIVVAVVDDADVDSVVPQMKKVLLELSFSMTDDNN